MCGNVLTAMGLVSDYKVAMKPGKPVCFGHIDNAEDSKALFFGLARKCRIVLCGPDRAIPAGSMKYPVKPRAGCPQCGTRGDPC